MKWKQLLLIIGVSAVSAISSMWVYGKVVNRNQPTALLSATTKLPVNYAGFYDNNGIAAGEPVDFTKASAAAVPAVVHIKTKINARKVSSENAPQQRRRGNSMEDFFDDFFNFGPNSFGPMVQPEQRASGSGVIVDKDGYIVTNNHVIAGSGGDGVADEITVTLSNKKTYKAKLIGRDPSTDLAVIKIDATNLPYMIYGNSDEVKLGQWVLAVGYPFTLETTVTAGIVSAKERTIGINSRQSNSPVEMFIQTDAAINQGNSGGALITTTGELIGINSAIFAPNQTYAGYGFAIPVNIVRKIIGDLIEFGDVKRGFLGISYPSQDNESYVKRAGVKDGSGVYALAIPADGAAAKAGIKKGDVITKINNRPVTTGLEMSGQIASYKPGEKVNLTYVREGKEYTTTVTLGGELLNVKLANTEIIGDRLGVELENVDSKNATQYKINGGVKVKSIKKGGPFSTTRMEEGFVITTVNGRDIKNIDEFAQALGNSLGKIKLDGIYPGYSGVYSYQIDLNSEDY